MEVETDEHFIPVRVIFHVVGIVSELIPYAEVWENRSQGVSNVSLTNSGFTVIVPIDPVLTLVNDWESEAAR